MNGGVKAALFMSCAALGGCTAGTDEVKVRPIADPAAAFRGGGDTVALARGQLMIGDAGLALEGFRKAQRYDPNNPAALQGIGDCYAAMGRFDIAQSNYEAALALAPHDRRLLLGLADIFEREGLDARAMAVRAEAGAVAQVAAIAPSAIQTARPAAAPAEHAVAIPAPATRQHNRATARRSARGASRVPCGPPGAAPGICRAGRFRDCCPAAGASSRASRGTFGRPTCGRSGICASVAAGDGRTSESSQRNIWSTRRRFGRSAAGVFARINSRHGREGRAG